MICIVQPMAIHTYFVIDVISFYGTILTYRKIISVISTKVFSTPLHFTLISHWRVNWIENNMCFIQNTIEPFFQVCPFLKPKNCSIGFFLDIFDNIIFTTLQHQTILFFNFKAPSGFEFVNKSFT